MFRRVMFAVLLALPLSCASSGSTTNSEGGYPWGMIAFSSEKPPKCPYEEVGRITYEGGEPYRVTDIDEQVRIQQAHDDRMRELLQAYDELEADAVVEPRRRGGAREFSFIRFSDPDCRE